MRAVFPRTKLEFAEDFQMDRVNSRRPFVYDQVVLADRAASMRGKEFVKTERTARCVVALLSLLSAEQAF